MSEMSSQGSQGQPPMQAPRPVEPSPAPAANAAPPVTKRRAALAPGQRVDRLPQYHVILHNDAVNDMVYVVDTLVDLTPLNAARAADVMLEAHQRGLALVLTTHRERAELYVEQFKSKKLTVTMEPGP